MDPIILVAACIGCLIVGAAIGFGAGLITMAMINAEKTIDRDFGG